MPYASLDRFILAFIGLFVVVDPFAAVPVILALTKDAGPGEIERIARRASLFGAGILLFFALAGAQVFRFLQIDLNAFRAAGGLLLLITALGMLRSQPRWAPSDGQEAPDLSVVPFATPLLAGPGAITSVVVFSGPRNGQDPALETLAVLALAIALVFLLAYLILRGAKPIRALLGKSGITVVQQMMGLLLAALSLQFIVQGLVPLVKALWAA
jgi:multiple antibiotic resistance protein